MTTRRRWGALLTLPLVAAALLGQASATVGVPSTASPATTERAECDDVLFIGARGSGQSQDSYGGFGREVNRVWLGALDGLDPAATGERTVRRYGLPYPAYGTELLYHPLEVVAGGPQLYFSGLRQGASRVKAELVGAANDCPDQRFILSGYSQGALAIHVALVEMAASSNAHLLDRVDGAILIADPARNANTAAVLAGNAPRSSQGLTQHVPLLGWATPDLPRRVAPVTTQVCTAGDLVCAPASQITNIVDRVMRCVEGQILSCGPLSPAAAATASYWGVKGTQIHGSYETNAAARAAGVTAGARALQHLTDSDPEEPDPEPGGAWTQVSAYEDPARGSTTCAVAGDGSGHCWGVGDSGQLGNGGNDSSNDPVPIVDDGALAGKKLERFAVGEETVCALTTDGYVSCWGGGHNGRLGNDASDDSNVPVATSSFGALAGKRVIDIAVGFSHACALDDDGRAYCWGDNFFGQLGHFSDSQPALVATPVEINDALAGARLVDITAGYNRTCALDDDGFGYCWGSDRGFELGRNEPMRIPMTGALNGERIAKISAAGSHMCALTESGQAFCWGYNEWGQLGNGQTGEYLGWDENPPRLVDSTGVLRGRELVEISAHNAATCVLDSAGHAYCWGLGSHGYPSDGPPDPFQHSVLPVRLNDSGVLADKTLTSLGGTCTIDRAGDLYCWDRYPNIEPHPVAD